MYKKKNIITTVHAIITIIKNVCNFCIGYVQKKIRTLEHRMVSYDVIYVCVNYIDFGPHIIKIPRLCNRNAYDNRTFLILFESEFDYFLADEFKFNSFFKSLLKIAYTQLLKCIYFCMLNKNKMLEHQNSSVRISCTIFLIIFLLYFLNYIQL